LYETLGISGQLFSLIIHPKLGGKYTLLPAMSFSAFPAKGEYKAGVIDRISYVNIDELKELLKK